MASKGKIKGLKELIKKLENVESSLYKDIDAITEVNAQDIATIAKSNAPKAFGNLAQSIKVEEEGSLKWKTVANAKYSGYVEFGTGSYVSIPNELKDQASKFKSGDSGSFKEGLKAIKDWCKKKGIDEEAAYPILVSIIRNGQHAQPFLYPAWVKGRKNYLSDLKSLLETEFKNI